MQRGQLGAATAEETKEKKMKTTVDVLFEKNRFTIEDVAEKSNLPADRVEAIAMGRWTPNPQERKQMAAALGVSVEDINWGHTMDPRNIRYHRFGLEKEL